MEQSFMSKRSVTEDQKLNRSIRLFIISFIILLSVNAQGSSAKGRTGKWYKLILITDRETYRSLKILEKILGIQIKLKHFILNNIANPKVFG